LTEAAMNTRLLEDDEEDEDDEKEGKVFLADPLAGKMLKTRTILISGEINKELAEKNRTPVIVNGRYKRRSNQGFY